MGFGLAVLAAVSRWDWPASLALVWFMAIAVLITVVDFETMLIPDRLNAVGLGGALVLLGAVAMIAGEPERIGRMAIGAVTFTVVLGLAHLAYPAGLGFGDVKAAPLLGAYLGWSAAAPGAAAARVLGALFVASLVGSVVGVALLAGRGGRREFPFGPALVVGTLAMLLVVPDG